MLSDKFFRKKRPSYFTDNETINGDPKERNDTLPEKVFRSDPDKSLKKTRANSFFNESFDPSFNPEKSFDAPVFHKKPTGVPSEKSEVPSFLYGAEKSICEESKETPDVSFFPTITEDVFREESGKMDTNSYCNDLNDAAKIVISTQSVSTTLLQRKLKIGYSKAARLMDELEELGVIGPFEGSKPRTVIMSYDEWIKKYEKLSQSGYDLEEEYHNGAQSDEMSRFDELMKEIESQLVDKESEKVFVENTYAKIGVETDYSDDGFFLNKLDNYIILKTEEKIQYQFINHLLTYSSPDLLKLILINDSLGYNKYNGLPNLMVPVVTDNKKAGGWLSWAVSELKKRISVFSSAGCEDISSYNQYATENTICCPMYSIIIVINEVYNILNNPEAEEAIMQILLNAKRTGIYLYLFSKFSIKYLSLGAKADLLKVGDASDLERIFEKESDDKTSYSLDDIDNKMTGTDFEKFCGSLLKNNGFINITVTQSSNDYGADVVAVKDGIKYAIQCKKYSSPVGISAIQEVMASKTIYNCHVACVLTNNSFTPAAEELANKALVLLWDRSKLKELINKASTND